MLDSFLRLGEKYPDIAAEIYLVAQRPLSEEESNESQS